MDKGEEMSCFGEWKTLVRCFSIVCGMLVFLKKYLSLQLDAREVLQRDHHQISKIVLHVKKYQQELKPDPSETSSSLVVLENVPETMIECMLILLVETVSGLSEEDKDFDVEMVPECSVAVITFIKPIGKKASGIS